MEISSIYPLLHPLFVEKVNKSYLGNLTYSCCSPGDFKLNCFHCLLSYTRTSKIYRCDGDLEKERRRRSADSFSVQIVLRAGKRLLDDLPSSIGMAIYHARPVLCTICISQGLAVTPY